MKINDHIIKANVEDYEDMKKVRDRNRKFTAYKQDDPDKIYNFMAAYRIYFGREILEKNRFREDFYFKDKEKEKRICK
jgi:hypothetical protein